MSPPQAPTHPHPHAPAPPRTPTHPHPHAPAQRPRPRHAKRRGPEGEAGPRRARGGPGRVRWTGRAARGLASPALPRSVGQISRTDDALGAAALYEGEPAARPPL
ncbi:hypothetical protein SPRI_5958 [Streptomyces pristinaespiralis]|uniref:Uncharacterized protein n=1 Tax=Streptomyces pristinaespiralis TaxID=38300 RepID=A0A0M4DGU5_STRPR|nr:hypothetical protein SPRI_5958 [Streptomyces pristinaespiralis]